MSRSHTFSQRERHATRVTFAYVLLLLRSWQKFENHATWTTSPTIERTFTVVFDKLNIYHAFGRESWTMIKKFQNAQENAFFWILQQKNKNIYLKNFEMLSFCYFQRSYKILAILYRIIYCISFIYYFYIIFYRFLLSF